MRKLTISLITLSMPPFADCRSGVTVEVDSPVDTPEEIEVGGVTTGALKEVTMGEVT